MEDISNLEPIIAKVDYAFLPPHLGIALKVLYYKMSAAPRGGLQMLILRMLAL